MQPYESQQFEQKNEQYKVLQNNIYKNQKKYLKQKINIKTKIEIPSKKLLQQCVKKHFKTKVLQIIHQQSHHNIDNINQKQKRNKRINFLRQKIQNYNYNYNCQQYQQQSPLLQQKQQFDILPKYTKNSIFYNVITAFGGMTLIWEQCIQERQDQYLQKKTSFNNDTNQQLNNSNNISKRKKSSVSYTSQTSKKSQQIQKNNKKSSQLIYFQQRKQLLFKNQTFLQLFPLIFQQQIIQLKRYQNDNYYHDDQTQINVKKKIQMWQSSQQSDSSSSYEQNQQQSQLQSSIIKQRQKKQELIFNTYNNNNNYKSKYICLTLIQQVKLFSQINFHIKDLQAKQMILCAMQIQFSTQYKFSIQQYQIKNLLMRKNRSHMKRLTENDQFFQRRIFFDFTKLMYKYGKNRNSQNNFKHCQQKLVQIFSQKLSKIFLIPKKKEDLKLKKNSQTIKISFDSSSKEQIFNIQRQKKEYLQQVIIVKQKVYRPLYQLISKAIYWFQLIVWLNLLPNLSVSVVKPHNSITDSPIRKKQSQLWKLSGKPQIIYQSKHYKQFIFEDGKCVNIFRQISVDQLRQNFFRKNILYVVQRRNNTIIKKYENFDSQGKQKKQKLLRKEKNYIQKQQLQSQKKSKITEKQLEFHMKINQKISSSLSSKKLKRHFTLPILPQLPSQIPTDTIVIQQNVPKIQCINFFITYLSYIQPTLYVLQYFPNKNTLRLHMKTQVNPRIVINLIFHPEYILKDQEISMVLEKCSLEKCQLLIRKMNITDSLLLFLANSQKMDKIIKIDLSGCCQLSQNGINSLLISPYCKKLQQINLSQLPISQAAFQSISYKLKKLTRLKLNNCFSNFQNVSFINLKLHALQAIGLNLHPNFSDTINILKIDCQIQIQNLRNFRNMILTQLKLKLIQNKKNIINNVFGNFLKDSNPIKTFADGPSRKTLKYLDLSGSSVKLKILKPIFNMQTLQTLLLQNYQKPGNQVQHVSPRLLNLSIRNSFINIHQFGHLISKTPHFVSLNITKSQIKKQQIVEYLYSHKKYTNIIQISQEQYTNKFLDSQKSVVQCIKVHVFRLLNPESQYIFNHMLYKAAQAQNKKTLYLLSQQQNFLILKVKKYLVNSSAQAPKNIHINDRSYFEITDKVNNSRSGFGSDDLSYLLNEKIQYIQIIDRNNQIKDKSKNKSIQNKYKYSSYPKASFSAQNIPTKVKKWNSDDPIDVLTYNFVKTLKTYPNSLLGVYLNSNKVLGPQAIQMMYLFGGDKIINLDFRKSLFKFSQVSSLIFQFPLIQKINQGAYQITLNGNNFVQQSQKNLKFFMRISNVTKLQISIRNIRQAQILYSVLYHILDHHNSTLYQLQINLSKARISLEAINFWTKIFELKKLRSLKIQIQSCQQFENVGVFDRLNQMSLYNLQLKIPSKSLPQSLQIRQLLSVVLTLSEDLNITDNNLGKFLKPLSSSSQSLKSLTLICDRCSNITNLSKLSHLNKIISLQQLTISFQYCNLKESSLLDFIESLKQLKCLRKLQLNISFTIQNWNQLLRSVQILHQGLSTTKSHNNNLNLNVQEKLSNISNMLNNSSNLNGNGNNNGNYQLNNNQNNSSGLTYIKIIAVNQTSKDFVFNRQQMTLKGVQFIM